MTYRCPICRKIVRVVGDGPARLARRESERAEQAGFLPFCSQRCKLIDLGHWFDADYKILTQLQSGASERSAEAVPEDRHEQER